MYHFVWTLLLNWSQAYMSYFWFTDMWLFRFVVFVPTKIHVSQANWAALWFSSLYVPNYFFRFCSVVTLITTEPV